MSTNPSPEAVKKEIHRFSRTTTIRGIIRIANPENSYALRILWTTAVVSAASITIYQLSTVVSKYLQYQKNVNMFFLDMNPEFPDITACKVNPYAHHWVDPRQPKFDEFYNYMKKLQSDMRTGSRDINFATNSSDRFDKIMDFLVSPDGYYANLMLNEYELWPNMSTMIRDIGFYSWNMMKYREPDLLLSSVLSMAYNPDFQICYHLHVPEKRAHDVRAMTSIFYTRDFPTDSIPVFDTSLRVSPTPSVSVVLHGRGSYPDSTLAVSISPGHETTISVHASVIKRLGMPYDKCEDRKYLTKSGEYEPGALRYTVDACYDLCVQHHVMKTCGCIDSTRTFTPVELNSGTPLCGYVNFTHGFPPTDEGLKLGMEQLDCYYQTMPLIESGIVTPECKCPIPCLEYGYQTSVFSTAWPHRSFQLAFYEDFIKGIPTFGHNFDVYSNIETNENLTALQKLEKLNSLHLIEQNFLRLKIVFEDRGMQTYNSTPALTWEGLASNIGGSLSLWVGITVMTLFEFVELVIRMIELGISKIRAPKAVPSTATNDTEKNDSENGVNVAEKSSEASSVTSLASMISEGRSTSTTSSKL